MYVIKETLTGHYVTSSCNTATPLDKAINVAALFKSDRSAARASKVVQKTGMVYYEDTKFFTSLSTKEESINEVLSNIQWTNHDLIAHYEAMPVMDVIYEVVKVRLLEEG